MNAGMKDMTNVMSKFINLGMGLNEVIAASTWIPAKTIKREQLGSLTIGLDADVAIFNLREGNFGFIDAAGYRMNGTKKLECELTIRDGKIVFDLNGISRPTWNEK
jgi:dihydroorotase